MFTRYAEKDKSKIRPHKYKEPKTCKSVRGYDANSLYLSGSGQEMPCGKEEFIEPLKPTDSEYVNKVCEDILANNFFGFCQVDIHVPENIREKFEEFSPLFVVDSIPEELVPEHMKQYKKTLAEKL